jgi:hypothetical protein
MNNKVIALMAACAAVDGCPIVDPHVAALAEAKRRWP